MTKSFALSKIAASAIVAATLLASPLTPGSELPPLTRSPSAVVPLSPAVGSQVPTGFLWGAATSSYQVEGGIDCSTPTLPCNDYDFFNSDPTIHSNVAHNSGIVGPKLDLKPAGVVADDEWNPATYKRDFDNARLLGLNSLRISLEWSRIEPSRDTWDDAALQHYVDMAQAMLDRGIEPIITLNHFTLPIWVLRPPNGQHCIPLGPCQPSDQNPGYNASLRGWDNAATVSEFAEFVQHVVPAFQGKVQYWLTLNEPVGSMTVLGYILGPWSPGFVGDGPKAKHVLHNLIDAHVRAYDIIHDCGINPDCSGAKVGFAHAEVATVPADPRFGTIGDNSRAASNFSYFTIDYFVNAVVNGDEDLNYLETASTVGPKEHHPDWVGKLDFLGVNYYRRLHVYHDPVLQIALRGGFVGGGTKNNLYGEEEPHELLNDLGWANYPQGLYELIMQAKRNWNLPVMITENGTPEREDRNRAAYTIAHLRAVQRAMSDGASVIGYMHWSLIDNWELQSNYDPRAQFGLFHIDASGRQSGDLTRHMTEGALAYQQVIANSKALDPTGAPTPTSLDDARSKFGELTADGTSVVAPTQTPGRLWEGTTSEGPLTLYLGSTAGPSRIAGMTFYASLGQWRNVELRMSSTGPYLHEYWYDDAANTPTARDIAVSYQDGGFVLPGVGHVLARIPGTGVWRWNGDDSPWGGSEFAVYKLQSEYTGKFMTFSAPRPADGARAGLPQVAGSSWRTLDAVAWVPDQAALELKAQGRDVADDPAEDLFDVRVGIGGPAGTMGETLDAESGSFKVTKIVTGLGHPFARTGYLAPAGDNTWLGERDGSTTSKFHFLETRALFHEFPVEPAADGFGGNAPDQYSKENDPLTVMPVKNFAFHDGGLFGSDEISWQAGGRQYDLVTGFPDCLSPFVCSGRWSTVAGLVAERLSERFPPVVAQLADQTIEGNTEGGALVNLIAPASFDLDGAPLSVTWNGNITAGTGQPTFLALGTHRVCATVDNGTASATTCAIYTIRDTTPPTIDISEPRTTEYEHSQMLTLDYAVTDVVSGVSRVSARVDGAPTLSGHGLSSGQVIDLLLELAPGPHNFEITAADRSGNVDSLTVNFTVIVSAASMDDAVDRFSASGEISNAGIAKSLKQKLAAAAAAGRDAADNIYRAFQREVSAQSGKSITPRAADILGTDVQYLLDS
jgi:beta-glucosidase